MLAEVFDHYDQPLHREYGQFSVRALCHPDSHASCTIDLDRDLWYCFTCDKGGGPIHLIALMEGLSYSDADKYAARLFGDSYRQVQSGVGGERDGVGLFGRARNKRGRRPYVPAWRRN